MVGGRVAGAGVGVGGLEVGREGTGGERETEREQLLPRLLRSCYAAACLRALLIRFSTARPV